MTQRDTGLKVSEIIKRMREGVDPNDIQETEAAMDAAADYIEALQAAATLWAGAALNGEKTNG